MANGRDASKHLHHGESACPYAARASLEAGSDLRKSTVGRAKRARCGRIRRGLTRARRNRFRFVLIVKVNARDQLWTSAALPVDGLGVQLRGFRKSHHLIPAS
jgi:hypothetical protein